MRRPPSRHPINVAHSREFQTAHFSRIIGGNFSRLVKVFLLNLTFQAPSQA
jgi:hypothetical protein